ncbi:MAG: hypothetical protein M3271_06215, partial [Actinomycetota bacterium]|nr:hypothetical protein [Actinomycetota bacterium]
MASTLSPRVEEALGEFAGARQGGAARGLDLLADRLLRPCEAPRRDAGAHSLEHDPPQQRSSAVLLAAREDLDERGE